jgi:hypothetical protein
MLWDLIFFAQYRGEPTADSTVLKLFSAIFLGLKRV